MAKKIGKVVEIILNFFMIFISIILLFVGYYFFQTQIQKKDYANIFGYTVFEVSTGSMSPTIEVGDIIFVKLKQEIQENDIIVFKEENSFITHRLIKINENILHTKGDANNSEDKPILKEQVIGRVIYINHEIGILKKVIFTPEVFICIIVSIVLFGIAFSFKGKNTNNKDEDKITTEKSKEEEKGKDV